MSLLCRHELTLRRQARTHLCMMDKLTATVSTYVEYMCQLLATDDFSTNCSKTAGWALEVGDFDAGSHSSVRHEIPACLQVLMDKPLYEINIAPLKMIDKCPALMSHPSVTYVNMTGGSAHLIGDAAETDGHRFILLQADGMVRVLQACKGIY